VAEYHLLSRVIIAWDLRAAETGRLGRAWKYLQGTSP
jgi:hypothetical protein